MLDKESIDKQKVSAWVDNELESALAEQSYQLDSQQMTQWSRYHLIGQVMRGEATHLELDIASQVSEKIALEPSHQSEAKSTRSNVIAFPTNSLKQIAGYAIAASVALAVLFNLQSQSPLTTGQPVELATAEVQQPVAQPQLSASLTAVERQELQTIHDMFIRHEALSQLTGSTILPKVQVVSNQKVIPVSVPLKAEDKAEAQSQEAQQP